MTARMKSVCASGSEPHFCRLPPSPTPQKPPRASAIMPWIAWKPALSGVGLRVE